MNGRTFQFSAPTMAKTEFLGGGLQSMPDNGSLRTAPQSFSDLESCQFYSAQWSYGNPTKSITTPDGNNITIDVTVDAGEGETACLTIVDDDSTTSDDPIFYDGYYNVKVVSGLHYFFLGLGIRQSFRRSSGGSI